MTRKPNSPINLISFFNIFSFFIDVMVHILDCSKVFKYIYTVYHLSHVKTVISSLFVFVEMFNSVDLGCPNE